jgi:hypothetical protein
MTRNKIALILGLGLGVIGITGAGFAVAGGHGQPSSPPAATAARHPGAGQHAAAAPHRRAPATSPVVADASLYQTVPSWWRHGGRSRYARVAADLWKVIIKDVVKDDDDSYNSDMRALIADSQSALGDPPPAGRAEYVAAMRDLHRAGEIAQREGSYARAAALVQAGLHKLHAFNVTAGLKA